jgi:hypothetical protein
MAESEMIRSAIRGFENYLKKLGEDEVRQWPSVERLIQQWLFHEDAIEDCAGDFRIFLSAAAIIFAEWHDAHTAGKKYMKIPPEISKARIRAGEVGHGEIFDPYAFIAYRDEFNRRTSE